MPRLPDICCLLMFASSLSVADQAAPATRHLTLDEAERMMLNDSPDISLSRLAYQASSADVVIAGESPNPQLSVNTSAINYRNGNGNGSLLDKQMDSVLRIDQLVERGNKRKLRLQSAQAGLDAAASDYADTLRTARAELAQTYFDLKYAQEVEHVYADMTALDQRALTAARIRLNAGDMSQIDVARLEIESAQTRSQWLNAQSTIVTARAALATRLGITTGQDSLDAMDDWPAPVTASAEPPAIDQRPDVMAAQSRQQQAQANVDLAKSQQTHDLTIGVQFEHYPQTGGNSSDTVGIGISVPLFIRHRYEGEIRRAMTDRETAGELLRQTRLIAGNEQQQAHSELDSAGKALSAVQDTILDKARQTNEAADFAYQRGALSLTDLLDAHRAFLNLELDALSAHLRYARALAAWRAQSTSALSSPPVSPSAP